MDEILKYLKSINIPSSQKRPNMSGIKYRGKDNRLYGYPIKSITMGLVRDWKTGGKMQSSFTSKHPELWDLLVKYGSDNVPHSFHSVCINHNTIAKPHYDSNNKGVSTIIAIGDFTGGELVVNDQVINIYNKLFTFDGSKELHWSLPFEGQRWSLIFFQ
jgi:hypothetical protein